MTDQVRKTILDALVMQIAAAVDDFKLVTKEYKSIPDDLTIENLPACLIRQGPGTPTYKVTGHVDIRFAALIHIIGASDSTIDDMHDLDEAVIDAINADVQLNKTCISALIDADAPPDLWDAMTKLVVRRVNIRYRREM